MEIYVPDDTSHTPATPDRLMRDLAQTVFQHSGPTSSGRLASIGIPTLGIDDIHFSLDGDATVRFRVGGDVQQLELDAVECEALAAFFTAMAEMLEPRS